MIVIGLTGSIGMGKTTVTAMLQQCGVPVHDADAEVHELMAPGGKAVPAVAAAFPLYEYPQLYDKKTKAIQRKELVKVVLNDMSLLERLESIMHPLVREAQQKFIRDAKKMGQNIVALDVPLLFETGADEFVDVKMVVSAPYLVQKKRVLERPNMDEEKFEAILSRQMPDSEKCRRADYVLQTGLGHAETMRSLTKILHDIRENAMPETA